MSVELINESIDLRRHYSREFWGKALELAQSYGWEPKGTRLPNQPGFQNLNDLWDGTYLTNDGQMVLTEDSLSLAEALTKALDDIPDTNIEIYWNPKLWLEDDLPEWLSPEEKAFIEDGLMEHSPEIRRMHPFEFFAGAEKRHLIGLIRFCRLGSFSIL